MAHGSAETRRRGHAVAQGQGRRAKMRVAIGGFAHETNTFHPLPTTLADFQGPAGVWLRGDEILDTFAGTRSVIGGMLDASREQGWTILPTFFADHPPVTGTL